VPKNFADRLLEAIKDKNAPVCVGLDPIYTRLPAEITGHRDMNDEGDSQAALDAVLEFSRRVIRLIAPLVPAVKINSAFFERYYWEGIEAYFELIQEASSAGLFVIGDSKRGDIGSTAQLYAQSALADPDFEDLDNLVGPDAVTVSSYLGLDGLQPFIDTAREEQKGLFALVRTSNPSADVLQNARLESGATVAEHVAALVAEWAAQDGLVGENGYSALGAVVATRQGDQAARFRELMPQSLFLVPGYGAQGGAAADFAPYFKPDGTGALIAASRSVIFAYEDPRYYERFTSEWDKCIEQACKDFVADVRTILPT
jgi:orotidine-5'-phosphate decarboxylase